MANGNIKNLFKSFLIFVILSLILLSFVYLITNILLVKLVYQNHISYTKNLVKIAKNGINNYLEKMIEELSVYSKNRDIILLNEKGKFLIDSIQKVNSSRYSNVTRIDKSGKIVYTAPFNRDAIGKNVLYQEHNKKLFKNKTIVISKPFLAVQGYRAIAVASPVFRDENFDGGVHIPSPIFKDL